MLTISTAERRELRAKAHHLHPVVAVGKDGLTPSVLHEIDVNLLAHELIKIRVFSDVREERAALLERICGELGAAAVQHIGKLVVVWRPKPEEAPAKPAPARRRPRDRKGATAPAKAPAPTKPSRTRVLPMGKSAPQARRPREPNARGVARPPAAGVKKTAAAPSPRARSARPPPAPAAPTAGSATRRRRKT